MLLHGACVSVSAWCQSSPGLRGFPGTQVRVRLPPGLSGLGVWFGVSPESLPGDLGHKLPIPREIFLLGLPNPPVSGLGRAVFLKQGY